MSDSLKHSSEKMEPDGIHDDSGIYSLDLPVAPDWFSEEPRASWETGYKRSCESLKRALKNPRIWELRDREMVSAEFIWKD